MFTAGKVVAAQDLRDSSVVQKEAIGQYGVSRDGRQFIYGQVGGSNVTSGQLLVAEAAVANHTNRTVAASQVVGDLEIRVNIGATACAQDLYADGYVVVNDAAGEGVLYQIQGNSAGAGSDVVRVSLYEPITKALTVSVSEVSLIKNPAKSVVASATLSKAVGVTNVNHTAAYFGWFQNFGVASVTADGAVTKGYQVVQSNAVAGAVEVYTDSTAGATDLQEIVGVAGEALVDTENRAVFLKIG